MAAAPLNRVMLAAGSVADDLSYVALADISRILERTADYRFIGGLMVTALAYRWDLGASLYRETLDADLGVPPLLARNLYLAETLEEVLDRAGGRSGGHVPLKKAAATLRADVIVVDASVLAVALADDGQDGDHARARLRGEQLTAPGLVDLEVASGRSARPARR